MILGVGAASFLSTSSLSSVATLLPVIQRDLQSDALGIGVVAAAYQACAAGLLLVFGRLGDLRGRERVFHSGFVVFLAGGGLAMLAPGIEVLGIARAVQGIGAAMLFSNSVSMITTVFPIAQRGRALSGLGVFSNIGYTAGPAVAGVIADLAGWRGIFAAGLLLGIPLFAISVVVLRRHPQPRTPGRLDVAGILLFPPAVAVTLTVLQLGAHNGWLSLGTLMGTGTVVVLLAVFIAAERRHPSPLFELGLLRSRSFTYAAATSFVAFTCAGAVAVLLPFLLISGRGLSASATGAFLTALPVAQVAASPVAGFLSDHIGTRAPRVTATALMTAAIATLAIAGTQVDLAVLLVASMAFGAGLGGFLTTNTSQMITAAPAERRGTATAVSATARFLGLAVGAAIGATGAGAAAQSGIAVDSAIGPLFVLIAGLGAVGVVLATIRDERPRA